MSRGDFDVQEVCHDGFSRFRAGQTGCQDKREARTTQSEQSDEQEIESGRERAREKRREEKKEKQDRVLTEGWAAGGSVTPLEAEVER